MEVGNCNVKICGAFSGCQHSDTFIVCDVMFNSNNLVNNLEFSHKNKFFTLKLKLTVLDHLPFEMIIGRRDILKYDLLRQTELIHRVAEIKSTVLPIASTRKRGFTGFKKKKRKSLFVVLNRSSTSKSLIKEGMSSKQIAKTRKMSSEMLSSTPQIDSLSGVAESKTCTNSNINTSTNAPKLNRFELLKSREEANARTNRTKAVQVNDTATIPVRPKESVQKTSIPVSSVPAQSAGSGSASLKPADLGLSSYIPWDKSPLTYNEQIFQLSPYSAYGQEPAIKLCIQFLFIGMITHR